MSASYHPGVILAPPSAQRPGEIDRLNAILQTAGLGRPLGSPSPAHQRWRCCRCPEPTRRT